MSAITRVLVANRGEIARRVFRTARAMGLGCVAVYTAADAGEPFVTEADQALRLDSGYLDIEALVAAAQACGADAVHPGYGFLSENAGFARAVAEAGLVWIGPGPAVIEAMGDKLAARAAAERAGVPTLPCTEELTEPADVGFPLLVKVASGGGGKGMRLVAAAAELEPAVAASRREAERGFGDGRVYLERYVPNSHHVEIQILGDSHGQVVHLGERECSIQRRHQKIIEESPSPALGEALRTEMAQAALDLARTIGYRSAGTVEFLLDRDTGRFYFLEVNTRLQVEHPVTEAVTGIDLVREQIRVAAGEPLGYHQSDVAFTGHAIEARLYAEDPATGFLPATGALAAFEPAPQPAVRWDSGVGTGSVVGLDFDPMLAKVISHAPSRAEAAARLALALDRLHLGGVITNRYYLAAALRSEAFRAGDTTTDFVDRANLPRSRLLTAGQAESVAVAAAMWLVSADRDEAATLGAMPAGWRLGRLPDDRVELIIDGALMVVGYRPARDGSFAIAAGSGDASPVGEDPVGAGPIGEGIAVVHRWSAGILDIEWRGLRIGYTVTRSGDEVHLTGPFGTVTAVVVPRFTPPDRTGPTDDGLVAPMPGLVLEVRVETGQRVEAGQTLVVLEAMKMEHHMNAPAVGVVTATLVAVGDQVATGTPLLDIDLDDLEGNDD